VTCQKIWQGTGERFGVQAQAKEAEARASKAAAEALANVRSSTSYASRSPVCASNGARRPEALADDGRCASTATRVILGQEDRRRWKTDF
jgi:hypothetical protein